MTADHPLVRPGRTSVGPAQVGRGSDDGAPVTSPPKVSVVVPVYNTEAYLAQCLDSLVTQTLDEIEIIVVNDGSPDGSQAIIDDYADRYPDKIVALSQPNGGLGSARNLGIAHATGRYVGFVDSDDFVEPDMYAHLYEEAKRTSSDVAICRYRHYSLDGSYSTVGGNFPFAEGDVFPSEGFFLNSRIMIVVNKIYRAELVRRVPFQDTWFEDVAWSPVVMSYADRICYTPNAYYHYIKRDGTITASHADARTLEEVSSLRWALDNANPERLDQVAYMAAKRLLFDAEARPGYADQFAQAIHDLRHMLSASHFILDDPSLYLSIRPYLDERFATIPKTVLLSPSAHPDERRDLFAFPTDTRFVEVNRLAPVPGDVTAEALTDRPEALREYLQLTYVLENGGVVLGDGLEVVGPIAWALAASASFFGFEEPGRISPHIFGAVAGSAVMEDVLALFQEHLDEPSPLSAALDAHFIDSGRAVWDYERVEANFRTPWVQVDGACRVYATSVFSNDFGLGLATTSLYPASVPEADGDAGYFRTSPSYQEIAGRITLDYARWLSTQEKPRPPAAARRKLPKPKRATPLVSDTQPVASPEQAPSPKSESSPRPEPSLKREPTTSVSEPTEAVASGRWSWLPASVRNALGLNQPTPDAGPTDPEPTLPEPPTECAALESAASELPGPAAVEETPVPPRVLAVPEGAPLRVLLYVGGFTTATSAERARLIRAWLHDIFGPDVEASVLYTDRANAAQAQRVSALEPEGFRLVRRGSGQVAPTDGGAEWARVLGDTDYDLIVVATPSGGTVETSILAAAPSGLRALCRLGQDRSAAAEKPFDVVIDHLSELHEWLHNAQVQKP
jgi:glycosyltransferase involved in cell wall biosynthesis